MRYEVALLLIACGTMLVLAPPLSDYASARLVTRALVERTDFKNISSGIPPMSEQYRLGCWALGAAMIGISIYGSWNKETLGDEYEMSSR